MTFLELCNAVRANANIQGTITSTTGQTGIFQEIVDWVNDGYYDIQADHDNWRFLHIEDSITLSSGSREVDFSADNVDKLIRNTLMLNDGSDTFLREADYVSFRRAYPLNGSNIQTAKPTYYVVLPEGNDQIRTDTIADQNYTIYYEAIRTPDVLSGDSDTPLWAAHFHDLIVFKALMKYGTFYNAPEIYKGYEKEFNDKYPDFQKKYLPSMYFFTEPLI